MIVCTVIFCQFYHFYYFNDSYLCLCFVIRYIGEVHSEKVKQTNSVVGNQPCSVKNPIITVTEHTPTPSPDYMKRQVNFFLHIHCTGTLNW